MHQRVVTFAALLAAAAPASLADAQTSNRASGFGELSPTVNIPLFLQLPPALTEINSPEEATNLDPRFLNPEPMAGRPIRMFQESWSPEEAITSAGRLIGQGSAVWYAHSGRTASGERFDPKELTAAHRSLPFGTRVRVVNHINGKSVIVRINDRLSKTAARDKGLVIDLSRAAARRIAVAGRSPVALYLESGSAPIVATDHK